MHLQSLGNRLRHPLFVLALLGLASTPPSHAASGPAPESREKRVVSQVHTDAVSVIEEGAGIALVTRADVDGSLGVELDPELTLFNVEEATRTTVPDQPSYAVLGAAGADVWLAPEGSIPGQIRPGFSTEGLPTGLLAGDQLVLRLESVSGPGTLHIFQSGAFGDPIRRFSSTGSDYREWTLPVGTHAHANWAFSAAGGYTLTFSANATIDGSPVSVSQDYYFHVGDVPAAQTTTTDLVATPSQPLLGDPVTLTATMTPPDAVGYVEFLDGTTVLGHELSAGGSATFVTTGLGLGSHSLSARFVPLWLNDFTASTSEPASVTVANEDGVNLAIHGIAPSYQVGDLLEAHVLGYTLAEGESWIWNIRPIGSDPTWAHPFSGEGESSAGGQLEQTLGMELDGYEIRARVGTGSGVFAQYRGIDTPWVPIQVESSAEAFEANFPAGTFWLGDTPTIELSRPLADGESALLVHRYPEVPEGSLMYFFPFAEWRELATSSVDGTTLTATLPYPGPGSNIFDFAVQIVRDGMVVAISEPIVRTVSNREVLVEGMREVYRPGDSMSLSGSVFPSNDALTFRWDGPPDVLQEGSGAGASTFEGTTDLSWDGERMQLTVFATDGDGQLFQVGRWRQTINVSDADPDQQLFFFNSVSNHYHQGNTINLNLVADPALAAGDTIDWEWKWPGAEWSTLPGAAGESHAIIAEQAVDGVEVRATLTFSGSSDTMLAGPVTIHVDDHGDAARQQPTIAGANSFTAGDPVTLTRELPADGATILTTHLWERQAAGESEFSAIAGESGDSLSFAATLADDGAQYRVSILKPDGSLAYGPSPVVSIAVAPLTVPEPQLALSLEGSDLGATLRIPIGASYEIEFSGTMAEGTWEAVGEPLIGAGEPIHLVLPKNGDQGFYRLRERIAD
ncbi:MAG: choice-of-anchor M domain-containing protein [Verrucomicrobiales bacterium]